LQPPVGFVTTDRLSSGAGTALDECRADPGEQHTVEALRLIEPAIERIAISNGDETIAKVLLHRDHPDLAAQVSVHRLEAGRETSVRFDASRIAEYVEMELEAR
jgi:hypothetical protein